MSAQPTSEEIWAWLGEIPDPEIPVISLVDLGIVRHVAWLDGRLVVTVSPTYSGCPATSIINRDIETALRSRGIGNVELRRQLAPAWTTDWISAEGRKKLRAYGIVPPEGSQERVKAVICPHCGSPDTELISRFGSTPCKSNYRCRACMEPFERFKCI